MHRAVEQRKVEIPLIGAEPHRAAVCIDGPLPGLIREVVDRNVPELISRSVDAAGSEEESITLHFIDDLLLERESRLGSGDIGQQGLEAVVGSGQHLVAEKKRHYCHEDPGDQQRPHQLPYGNSAGVQRSEFVFRRQSAHHVQDGNENGHRHGHRDHKRDRKGEYLHYHRPGQALAHEIGKPFRNLVQDHDACARRHGEHERNQVLLEEVFAEYRHLVKSCNSLYVNELGLR